MKINKDAILAVALLAALLIGIVIALVTLTMQVHAISVIIAPWAGLAYTIACLVLVGLICLISELVKP